MMEGHNQKFVFQNEHSGFELIESLGPGMTLYSLSRKYNVTIQNLLGANPDLDPASIPLGFPVHIPISRKAISFSKPDESEDRIWLCYRVQPKETLYRISTSYLNTNPEVITELNPSARQGLTIGQVLHLGWLLPSGNQGEPTMTTSAIDSMSSMPKDFIKEAKSEGLVVREQKGLAVWKPGAVSSQFYVLHSSAKIGTYMEITNPMLHRTITAKVSGNIPPGLYQSHVGIVVSPSTARALGVLDQQFFARWRYVE
ncbi:MAG: LysM domain-containing protein [Saprospiraceae bacterium]